MDVKRLNHFTDEGFEVLTMEELQARLSEPKKEKPVTASADKEADIKSFSINQDSEQEL
jgi:hypothetical protein